MLPNRPVGKGRRRDLPLPAVQNGRRALLVAVGMLKRTMSPIASVNQIAPSGPAASHPGYAGAEGAFPVTGGATMRV
jgi:hypothetical protein